MSQDIKDLFASLAECDAKSKQGSICKVLISQLRPTQNGIGLDEINTKRKKIRKKGKELAQLKDYLVLRTIPIVIGNGGQFYLIDHHHLAYAVWKEFKDIYLPVKVVKNWSQIECYSFWKAMFKSNWLYPYSGNGAGPLCPDELKSHVKDLENDVYRSLSWIIRKKYGYVKSPQNAIFAEFKWGNFFRHRIFFEKQIKEKMKIEDLILKDVKKDDAEEYIELLEYALYLATSKEARGLPGYRGC